MNVYDQQIHIFEWPDRFFIETDEPDRDLIEIFGDYEPYPYLVDLGEPPSGWCGCRDFRFNSSPILPLHEEVPFVNFVYTIFF